MNDLPKPDFSADDDYSLKHETTPKSSPPSHSINSFSSVKSKSDDKKTGINSSSNLSSSDNEALCLFLSLINDVKNSIGRLYSFCEHFFIPDLTSLTVTVLEKQLLEFKSLEEQISSQEQVAEQLQTHQTPSPVSFSIVPFHSPLQEHWPEPTSNAWIDVARSQVLVTPPEITDSPKRDATKLEEREALAAHKRRFLNNKKQRAIRSKTNRVRKVHEKFVLQQQEAKTNFNEKLDSAAQRREANLNARVEKAKNEIEKVQETNVIQRLETDTLKLKLDQKQNRASKRYEDNVLSKKEAARERSLIHSPSHNSPQRISIIDTISDGKLPPSPHSPKVFNFSSTSPHDITLNEEDGNEEAESLLRKTSVTNEIISLPDISKIRIINSERKSCSQLQNFEAKMKHKCDPSTASKYLKIANENKVSIDVNSEGGKSLIKTFITSLENSPNDTGSLIHQFSVSVNNSPEICFLAGLECCRRLSHVSEKSGTLKTVEKMIELWSALISSDLISEHQQSPSPQEILLQYLISNFVFDRLCIVLEETSESDLKNSKVKELASEVLSFLLSLATYTRPSETFSSAIISHIAPSISTFMVTISQSSLIQNQSYENMLEIAIRTFSLLALRDKDAVNAFADGHAVSSVIQTARVLIAGEGKYSESTVHGIIVLIGLLCRLSKLARESVLWLPPPNILQLLCNLKLNYFIQKKEANVLIPTIVAACMDSPENTEFVTKTINGALIAVFLKSIASAAENKSNMFDPLNRVPQNRIQELVAVFQSSIPAK